MSPTRLLLFSALGLGGLLVFAGKASAATPTPATEPEKETPPPKPTTSTQQAAQMGGADCKSAFEAWRALADRAAVLCAEVAPVTDMWWDWEELRLANDPSYDPVAHERVRARWEQATDNCNDINSDSLAAMARYEACMVSLGLNPALPSAATRY
jgi:hypothetical protein